MHTLERATAALAFAVLALGSGAAIPADASVPARARHVVVGTSPHAAATGSGSGSLRFGDPTFLTPLKRSGDAVVGYPSSSGDGSVVAFVSNRPDLLRTARTSGDVYVDAGGVRTRPYPATAMTGPHGRAYWAWCARVSRDGRYVMFCSDSPKLVPGDTNGKVDTFVYDRVTRRIDRVNVSSSGAQSGEQVRSAAISADGRYVAFVSPAHDLVPGDTNDATDVFVRDRVARTTTRVSVSATGRQANSDSAYGNDTPVVISGNGRYVGFDSWASNLVPGDTNRIMDIFVRDRVLGTTERVSVDDRGRQMAWNPVYERSSIAIVDSISDNGRFVAFTTDGTGIGGVAETNDHNMDQFLRDRATGRTRLVSQRGGTTAGKNPGSAGAGQLTPDGRLMTFVSNSAVLSPFSTSHVIFAYETATGRLSRAPGPIASVGMLTSDGHAMLYIKSDPTGGTSVLARRTIS